MTRKVSWLIAALALTAFALAPTAPHAAEWRSIWTAAPAFQTELGARYWYGWGSTAKDLYNTSGSALVSRLTYGELQSHAVEMFGRLEYSRGWFVKGYAGGGVIAAGHLNDEDFPPGITPYSSTDSAQRNGGLGFVNIDGGFNVLKGGDFKLGAFVGYHLLYQKVSAYGCVQQATHPAVCVPTIADTVKVITQENWWHSLRLGLNGEVTFADRVKLNVDAAYLPFVKLYGADAHWLRIGNSPGDFAGSVPEDGTGWGYQLEAVLSYQVDAITSIGIGGRYWHMQSKGNTHFEEHVVNTVAAPQPVKWKTDLMGVFLQVNFRIDPYITGRP